MVVFNEFLETYFPTTSKLNFHFLYLFCLLAQEIEGDFQFMADNGPGPEQEHQQQNNFKNTGNSSGGMWNGNSGGGNNYNGSYGGNEPMMIERQCDLFIFFF